MDISFANAIRNASNAWGQNRPVDAMTMTALTKGQPPQASAAQTAMAPTLGQLAVIQPELARYGHVGTKLNLYA